MNGINFLYTMNRNKKKKRGQRATGGDKVGRGLRQFSMKGSDFALQFTNFEILKISHPTMQVYTL